MDFVKTMLAFMALTFAANVQSAPVPEVTVAPTQPPAVVTLVPDANATLYSAPTATPTQTPQAAPTMTPNKAYKTLQMGDKGNRVKEMQKRLIELGYLSGSADGAYGTQTRTAVRLFQKENGLTRDGIAGPITQTVLFEDPNVKPNPATITPTPVATATPGPDGLVPLPEDPLALWSSLAGTRILLDGTAITLPNGSIPQVYRRGMELMIGLNGLAAGVTDWRFSPDTAAHGFTLNAAGYELVATIRDVAATARTPDDDSYCDLYTLIVDGQSVTCGQGDLVSERGAWYISDTLLKRVFGATVTLDEEEQVILLHIPVKGAAQSAD